MTNELGTTLQDIEAKADRKREALECAEILYTMAMYPDIKHDITAIVYKISAHSNASLFLSALECAEILYTMAMYPDIKHDITARKAEETIRKYIEDN